MKNDNPLVYIVLPIYNGEKYFLEQLMSLYYQNYTNWYLIIVNDGSTDNSEKIAREFISHYHLYDKVKILCKENGGLNSAITRGLEEIKKMCDIKNESSLVCYCDADDIRTREKLAIQVKYMLEHSECGLSYHDLAGINAGGILRGKSVMGTRYNGDESFLFLSCFGNHISAITIMYRVFYIKDILPMPVGEGVFNAQDYWTVLVLSLLGVNIQYINIPLGFYRNGYYSLSEKQKKSLNHNKKFLKIYLFLQSRFPEKNLSQMINYNEDRLINWEKKSLLTIYMMMLLRYPKIFFSGFSAQIRRFLKHGFSIFTT